MKKQNGFISSSSSVAVAYSTTYLGKETYKTQVKNWTTTATGQPYSIMTQLYDSYNSTQSYSWQTYQSTCYQRIQYFLEATQKLNQPFTKDGAYFQNFYNYSSTVALQNVYNGFVDVVVTLPCRIRLTGIQLINPWVSETTGDNVNNWMYLPKKFNIYKVNTENLNQALDNISYQTDVARSCDLNKNLSLRPVKYDALNKDVNMTLLGTYQDINWKTLSSYKCFFKYNGDDQESINVGVNTGSTGTATWQVKQLVIRIFQTNKNLYHYGTYIPADSLSATYIQKNIYEFMLNQQLSYGTVYATGQPSLTQIKALYGLENISSINNPTGDNNWKFGSEISRSYKYVTDFKFKSGINYKLGGLQLLIAPDIFSISEMKMYNYAGKATNKVYIGQYNSSTQQLYYYGARTIKQSPYIDINQTMSTVSWRHNFNIPSNYLQGKLYVRFNMQYGSFKVGDVIDNLVNYQNAPISVKLTNNKATVNLANGIGFTNPDTGQFISFMNGVGIQMDHPGQYDALNAAIKVGAKIINAGSSVAASITGGCPFQIYFIVKRLF